MEPYTLNRNFQKQYIIDGFSSVIWTERYYGDSEVEMSVPLSIDMIQKLSVGTLLGLDDSDEIMILETMNVEGGNIKVKGIALLPWMNNRFVRASASHDDKHWPISGGSAGWTLWNIIYSMCVASSDFLDGTVDIGVDNPQELAIPGLGLADYDDSGSDISVAVPYGPVYNAMKEIATTYEIGMQIILLDVTDVSYSLGFRSYKGLDRTSGQTGNSQVRFSPQMDSLTDIKELQSIAALKTLVYVYAPSLKPNESADPPEVDLRGDPGLSRLTGSEYTGFDLRALMVFADDLTTDKVGGSASTLLDILNSRADEALTSNSFVIAVDGEIVPESQFKYGIHYNLGDIIEVQGNSGAIQTARITEFIRSQDSTGEKSYPTVTMIS